MFYMGIPPWKSPAKTEFLIDSQLTSVDYKGLGCAMQVNMKTTNTGTVQVYFVHIVYILLRWVPWMQSAVLFPSWTATGVKHSSGSLFLCHCALVWLGGLQEAEIIFSFSSGSCVTQKKKSFHRSVFQQTGICYTTKTGSPAVSDKGVDYGPYKLF